MKWESSWNYLNLINLKLDCDSDAILIKVKPVWNTCHLVTYSCFWDEKNSLSIFNSLFDLIKSRKKELPKNSYTTSLFTEWENRICEKIEEESLEVIQAVKVETKQRLIEESSDLLYHMLVLLVEKWVNLEDIALELKKRG